MSVTFIDGESCVEIDIQVDPVLGVGRPICNIWVLVGGAWKSVVSGVIRIF